MKYCINCGNTLNDEANFCDMCGHKVSKKEVEQNKRKTFFDGEIHKCPNCGEILNSFAIKCPSCGYELRGSKKNDSINILVEKLEKSSNDKEKIELISNYYIPNTKEDIYEFFILAMSNINNGGICVDAWQAKLDQAYHKAKFSFGKTAEFEYLKKLYLETEKKKKRRLKAQNAKKEWKIILAIILGSIGLLMMIIGEFNGYASGDENSPFYMLALLGFFPLCSIGFIFTSGAKKQK